MNQMKKKEVVLMTGASGFLAQHLIRELHNCCSDEISEIRCIDKRPFRKFLDYEEKMTMRIYEENCTDAVALERVLRGCSTVFHLAAKSYQLKLFPENEQYWIDNLTATEMLVETMLSQNVGRLIFVGDALADLRSGDYLGISETTPRIIPDRFMLGHYAESKFRAELFVSNAIGRPMQNGMKLEAFLLRPCPLYGEGENNVIPMALDVCKQFGFLPAMNAGAGGLFHMMYAGNLAALIVQTHRLLRDKPGEYNGQFCYCTDASVAIQVYDYLQPFVQAAGYDLSSFKFNYYFGSIAAYFLETVMKLCRLLTGKNYGEHLPAYQTVRLAGAWSVGFATRKMRLFLDFQPPYDPEKAMQRTLAWFRSEIMLKQRPALPRASA